MVKLTRDETKLLRASVDRDGIGCSSTIVAARRLVEKRLCAWQQTGRLIPVLMPTEAGRRALSPHGEAE
jgi:hypothetical protein